MPLCQHENQKDRLLGHDGQLVTQQPSYWLLSFGEIKVKLILLLSKGAVKK